MFVNSKKGTINLTTDSSLQKASDNYFLRTRESIYINYSKSYLISDVQLFLFMSFTFSFYFQGLMFSSGRPKLRGIQMQLLQMHLRRILNVAPTNSRDSPHYICEALYSVHFLVPCGIQFRSLPVGVGSDTNCNVPLPK